MNYPFSWLIYAAFKIRGQPQFRQLFAARPAPPSQSQRHCIEPGHHLSRLHVPRDDGFAARHHPVADNPVVPDPHLAAEDHNCRARRPGNSTCPAIRQCSPMVTLCAICTQLSSFVLLMIVFPSVARSMAQLPPISTSSPMMTPPARGSCGVSRRRSRKPEAVVLITVPGMIMTLLPILRLPWDAYIGGGSHLLTTAPADVNARVKRYAALGFWRRLRPLRTDEWTAQLSPQRPSDHGPVADPYRGIGFHIEEREGLSKSQPRSFHAEQQRYLRVRVCREDDDSGSPAGRQVLKVFAGDVRDLSRPWPLHCQCR